MNHRRLKPEKPELTNKNNKSSNNSLYDNKGLHSSSDVCHQIKGVIPPFSKNFKYLRRTKSFSNAGIVGLQTRQTYNKEHQEIYITCVMTHKSCKFEVLL